ncbi:MgtC/SapB family protein [Pseudidiomarina atlantica]|jgi:uncharacterized membrane protein (DUF4010 family)|uniref:MgtC/SapB family protein n=1 Tax=Pseudidiomarina atlantica TaxID=1517416 RepID=UPI000553F9D2|nr:MgtC/SapB family protein [Pseudidiomarina atlantica]
MQSVLFDLAYALGIGLILGLERGWSQRGRADGQRFAGLRTFAISSLLGAVLLLVSQQLAEPAWPLWLGGLISFALLIIVAHVLESRSNADLGITTPTTLLLTFCLGALCVAGQVMLAVPIAIVVALLLSLKPVLHQWVERLQQRELLAILQMLVISVVVLPLLPNEGYGPGAVLNPYLIGWMVVLITGISFVGYFASKLLGPHRGILLTGVLGGIASSTAVTLNMAKFGKESRVGHHLFVAAILIASATMFPRVLVEVAVVNRALLSWLVLPLGVMTLTNFIGVIWLLRRRQSTELQNEVVVKNPFDIFTALKFAGLLVAVLVIAHYAHLYFDDAGVYAVAAISGLTDVDAITLSLAKLANNSLADEVASFGILLAASVNTLVKVGLVVALGHRNMWLPCAVVCGLAISLGWLSLWMLQIAV